MSNEKTSGPCFEREGLLREKRGTERDMLAALLPPGWERMEALEEAAEVRENEQRENDRAPL